MQQILSLNEIRPRVRATRSALRSCASRWLENERTWIVSVKSLPSSPGSMGLRVTRIVLSLGRRTPGSIPPMNVSPKTMVALQPAPRATCSAWRNMSRLTRFCCAWMGLIPPNPPRSRS